MGVAFKNPMFIPEGDATRIALYLRSRSYKSKKALFKVMSPIAKLRAIQMEREQNKRKRKS